jgi:hypothetical protein
MENKSRNVVSLYGKQYAIYATDEGKILFNAFDHNTLNSENYSLMWLIWPGSEVAEILSSGDEKMLGVINNDCLVYANKATSKMECNNSFQYENILAKKVEAVFEFLKSDAYLFSLGS